MPPTKLAAFITTLALCSPWARAQGAPASGSPASVSISNPSDSSELSARAATPDLPFGPSASIWYKSAAESSSLAEDADSSGPLPRPESTTEPTRVHKFYARPFHTFAIGVKASTLGPAVEIATPLSASLNLRAIGHFIDLDYNFNVDGIDYTTGVNFRSGQLGVDWFPFHSGFHVSPGLLYFKHYLSGVINVPAGKHFSLEDVDYINSVDDPVSGTASVGFSRHIAPALTIGWGNIIPRSGRHLSLPFEIGAVYTGAGVMDVRIAGTACTYQGCFNAATDPDTQANLQKEIRDLNKEVKKFQYYPIISLGLAYRF
jgi:hypothetical protein